MPGKNYEDTKKEIRSVLLTYKENVTLEEFTRSYRNLLGQRLPSRDLGFSSDVEFLKSMPDVVDVKYDSCGKVCLSGIADKASQHIQELVKKQRTHRTTNNRRNQLSARQPVRHSNYAREPVRRLHHTLPNTRELKPFLPGALRAEILELMSYHKYGITLSSFALDYHRKFKKVLPLQNGLSSLEPMIKLIPELEVRKNENGNVLIYNRKYLDEDGTYKQNESQPGLTNGNAFSSNTVQEKSSSDIHESGIPDVILEDFRKVLQKCPDGIQNIHFPPLYELITGKQFDLLELGYNSLADLVAVLPHVFERVPNPSNEQCWLIYPAGSHLKKTCKAKNDTDHLPKQHLNHHPREGIPADASPPALQYLQSTLPTDIDLSKYIPVFASAILHPSLFWFQLHTEEFIENFMKLDKDLEKFYSSNDSYKYKMDSADIAVGATCVIQCPDDDQYYRAVIKGVPTSEIINVYFVDWGFSDSVPINNIYYVWSKLHEYPAFAFQAKLAGIKPSGNADADWSSEARKRFIKLCNCEVLMALISSIDKDSYSVYLCDTSDEKIDIHFHQTLINEGYAEISIQNQSDIKNYNSHETERISNGHTVSSDSDSSSTRNQDALQSDNSDVFSDANEVLVNTRLSLSTDVENSGVDPTAIHFSQDKNSKRYVKQIEIHEHSKIHLINLDNKLYMPCGELCCLLWNNSNPTLLTKKLRNKGIDIPFLHIKKEDYTELSNQCLWYKVPDFEKKGSGNSSVIMCPLEMAFDVLNIFGHPSVDLRIILKNEIKMFDPNEEYWNDASYEEPDILKEINKLCIYDLKMRNEALQGQKLKLLMVQADPQSEEIKRIEAIQNILTSRIQQIEAICSQYSSCS